MLITLLTIEYEKGDNMLHQFSRTELLIGENGLDKLKHQALSEAKMFHRFYKPGNRHRIKQFCFLLKNQYGFGQKFRKKRYCWV